MKRSNVNRSVPAGGHLPPIVARWGMRGIDHFTAEELVQLQQKLDGWIRQRAHNPERPQRRPWVMQRNMAHPANQREIP